MAPPQRAALATRARRPSARPRRAASQRPRHQITRSAVRKGSARRPDGILSQALRGLFALAESYPQLRASENFRELQTQLADTEDKVAYARRFYNARVLDYNTRIATIPAVLVAGPMGFRSAEFFAGDEAARTAPRVSFGQ